MYDKVWIAAQTSTDGVSGATWLANAALEGLAAPLTLAVGGLWEAVFAVVRRHEINEGFLVTWMLYPFILPPTVPLWQVALGISFGVVVGKEVGTASR